MEATERQELEEVRQTLQQLENRLRRDVADMVRVLEADVPAQLLRTVRSVFERSNRTDALDDSAVAALKRETTETATSLGRAVAEGLSEFELWTWDSAWPLPASPEGLAEHPRVRKVLARFADALQELLQKHGLEQEGERAEYKVPAYFVGGCFMKSLVSNYWRALADYHQLRQRLNDLDHAEQRQARIERWDRA